MSKLGLRFFILLCVFSLSLPLISQAQDDDGLSEEEIALIEQVAGIETLLDSYSSYSANRFDTEVSSLTLFDQENFSDESLHRFGYTLNDGETQNSVYNATFEYESDETYSIEGEVREIDEVVYVNAAYIEAEEDAEPIPEGWIVIESEEEIPDSLSEFRLSQHFEEETPLISDSELLIEYATLVMSTEITTTVDDEEVTLEQILITIDGENFLPFYMSILDEEAQENFIIQTIFSEGLEGNMTIIAQFFENGDIYLLSASIEVENLDIDAYAVDPEIWEEGDTVSFAATYTILMNYADFNGDFDPIEVPELD